MADSMCGPSNPLKHVQDHLSRAGQDTRLRSRPGQSSEAFRSNTQEASMDAENSFAEFHRGAQLDHVPILLPTHMGPGPLQPAPMQPVAFQPVAVAAQHANPLQHSQGPARHGASWAAEYAAMAPGMSRGAEMSAAGSVFLPPPAQGPILHRPHQVPAPSYMMANYGRPLFAGAARPAPTLAVAPVDPLADEAERARFDAAFAQLDQEFSEAVGEWDAAHGPDARPDEAAGIGGLMDRLADQRLEDEPLPQPQDKGASGDPELRAVAGQVVGMLGNVPLFERSQFAQLMRGIEAGTIVVDAAQTNFVDATTLEPVGSGAVQAQEKTDGNGN
ncbi:hypothetical protein RB595_002696 [Gaeumannomyces hyphopodioides]